MSTKEDLIKLVQSWMAGEKAIKEMQKKLREQRATQKGTTALLVEVMETHEIECLDMKEGRIVHTRSKVRSSVSKKHLMAAISTYFTGTDNAALPEDLTKHILESRTTNVKNKIQMKQPYRNKKKA